MGYTASTKICITGGHTVWDPADSTTYYFGMMIGSVPSTGAIYNIVIPQAGFIKNVSLYIACGTVGSAEDTPIYIRKNGATDYLIRNFNYDTSPQSIVTNNLNIPVAPGDIITFKTVTPAWATNPLQVRQIFSMLIGSK